MATKKSTKSIIKNKTTIDENVELDEDFIHLKENIEALVKQTGGTINRDIMGKLKEFNNHFKNVINAISEMASYFADKFEPDISNPMQFIQSMRTMMLLDKVPKQTLSLFFTLFAEHLNQSGFITLNHPIDCDGDCDHCEKLHDEEEKCNNNNKKDESEEPQNKMFI